MKQGVSSLAAALFLSGGKRFGITVFEIYCLKLKMHSFFLLTVKDDSSDNDVGTKEITTSPWSRGMIVGLCAGMTLVIILIVGLALLCRYSLRQRKLKMEFEDDVEIYRTISR